MKKLELTQYGIMKSGDKVLHDGIIRTIDELISYNQYMKTITENNKLIAEFLVKNEGGLVKLEENIFSTIDEFEIPDDYLTLKDLKYHKDWNWLMEVVEKIESLPDEENNGAFFFEIYQDSVSIIFSNDDYIIDLINVMGQGSRINNVYQAVVEFIQLYNKANESLS